MKATKADEAQAIREVSRMYQEAMTGLGERLATMGTTDIPVCPSPFTERFQVRAFQACAAAAEALCKEAAALNVFTHGLVAELEGRR